MTSKDGSKLNQWIKQKYKDFFCKRLFREIQNEIPLDLSQIATWFDHHRESGNNVHHPYIEVAQFYTNACMHERASNFYSRFLKRRPDKDVHSLYLQNLLLSATATNETLLAAHLDWAKQHVPNYSRPSPDKVQKKAGEKIKIGYLCHFFNNSISQNCLLPLLAKHDRNKFAVYCYNDGEMPAHKEQYADVWHDIRHLSHEAVADLIKRDGIDIVQELNGFCITNRFAALANRPAPIQINWYNHTSTTGLPFIDYVMSDVTSILDADLPFLVEKAYRHKDFIAAIHFDQEKFTPLPQDPPCIKNQYITFCYFGGSHKITLKAIELWARVLKAVPYSRLILKCGSFSHERFRRIFIAHFAKFSIPPSRFRLEGWSDQKDTLSWYNDIDIMLDNTPINGGTTMFEALLQGVPVVSLMGKRWAARSGPSVLNTLGHPELIAHSEDDYVAIAKHLANDYPALQQYRQTLRAEMQDSSLTNIQQFYQNFETAYLHMWNQWCTENNRS